MTQVPDLSTLGQNKEGKILGLKLPSPSEGDRPLTVKEFVEFSVHNFDQVGQQLKSIIEFCKGQNNVNEVLKQRLEILEKFLDNWVKEAKKLEEKSNGSIQS